MGQKNALLFEASEASSIHQIIGKIAEDVSDKKIVAISEGFHNCEEMLVLQQELIRYLVTHKGFSTIVTESGLPESKNVNNFIQDQDSSTNFWTKKPSFGLCGMEARTSAYTLAKKTQSNQH